MLNHNIMSIFVVAMLLLACSSSMAALTEKQKVEILNIFNKARSTTVVSASNMKMLAWDERIGWQMQNYTDKCSIDWQRFNDPPSYFFYRDHAADPVGVAHWRTLRMAPFYDLETGLCINTTQSNKICRIPEIYERGIVANLETVACGVTRCGPGAKGVFHACALGGTAPSGKRQKPFIPGPRCSACPSGWNYCVDGLCSKIPGTNKPTKSPTTAKPTKQPTKFPTKRPTSKRPTKAPTTRQPTSKRPTKAPTTKQPTSKRPTKVPTKFPTRRRKNNG